MFQSITIVAIVKWCEAVIDMNLKLYNFRKFTCTVSDGDNLFGFIVLTETFTGQFVYRHIVFHENWIYYI